MISGLVGLNSVERLTSRGEISQQQTNPSTGPANGLLKRDCTKLVSGSLRAKTGLGRSPDLSNLKQMITVTWRWHQTGSYKEYSPIIPNGRRCQLDHAHYKYRLEPKHFRKNHQNHDSYSSNISMQIRSLTNSQITLRDLLPSLIHRRWRQTVPFLISSVSSLCGENSSDTITVFNTQFVLWCSTRIYTSTYTIQFLLFYLFKNNVLYDRIPLQIRLHKNAP